MSEPLKFEPAKDVSIKYPPDWPPKEFFTHESELSEAQLKELHNLIENSASETEIDRYFRANPSVLAVTLSFAHTGNHGAWVIPQQSIRPKIGNTQLGLIPDYIIGGKNSDGFQWWIVELKGADTNVFVQRKNDVAFSKAMNEGLCQLLTYIDYCAETQATLRDQFKLTGFREPKGLILIGREDEFENSDSKRKLKSAWNRVTRHNLEIRSYDALLRAFRGSIDFWITTKNTIMQESRSEEND